MNMKNEIITVIIPSYNHEEYIAHSIESVINQTYERIELIIIDDGSEDNTCEVVAAYETKCNERFVRYRFIRKRNTGVIDSMNMGLDWSNGTYIAFLASDDAFLPNKLKMQYDMMTQYPEYAMVYGRAIVIDEKGDLYIQRNKEPEYKGGRIFSDIITLKFHPPVNYLYKKSVLIEMGGFIEGIVTEDFYMNCKISQKYEIGYINEYLSEYRMFRKWKFKRDLVSLFDSQRKVIDMFREEKIYDIASREELIRRFLFMSGVVKYKKNSLIVLLQLFPVLFDKRIIRGLIKLVVKWESFSPYY